MTKLKGLVLLGMIGLAAAGCSRRTELGAGAGAGDNLGEPGALVGDDPYAGAPIGSGNSQIDQASLGYFRDVVGDKVFFAVDQSGLSGEARAVLDGQAAWLNQNPSLGVRIEGHADEQGTREYNMALGERRANAVRDYLVTRGIAPTRIETVTFGKERPLAVCSDEGCWSQNRRAVTVVAGGLGS